MKPAETNHLQDFENRNNTNEKTDINRHTCKHRDRTQ